MLSRSIIWLQSLWHIVCFRLLLQIVLRGSAWHQSISWQSYNWGSNYVQIQFFIPTSMYVLDSHFWHRGKQTCWETKDRHKHRVPPALSAMGGQSTLVRLPAPTNLYTHILHTGGEKREVFAVPQNQVVSWVLGRVLQAEQTCGGPELTHLDPEPSSISVFIIFVKGVWQNTCCERQYFLRPIYVKMNFSY